MWTFIKLLLALALPGCIAAPPAAVSPTSAPAASIRSKLLSVPKAAATNIVITLAWDPSAGATGYKLYQGTASRAYAITNDVGAATNGQMNVAPSSTNWFAATAYNDIGESAFSSEVVYTAPAAPPPPTNLVIINVTIQASASLGPWSNVVTLPALQLLAPADPQLFYRGLLSIIQTNL